MNIKDLDKYQKIIEREKYSKIRHTIHIHIKLNKTK